MHTLGSRGLLTAAALVWVAAHGLAQEKSVDSILARVEGHCASIVAGRAHGTLEYCLSAAATASAPPLTFNKDVWDVGYAFDNPHESCRVDLWRVSMTSVLAGSEGPTETLSPETAPAEFQAHGDSIKRATFFFRDISCELDMSPPRAMNVNLNEGIAKSKIPMPTMADPTFAKDFLDQLKRNKEKAAVDPDFRYQLAIEGEASLRGRRQVVLKMDVLRRIGAGTHQREGGTLKVGQDSCTWFVRRIWVNAEYGYLEKVEFSMASVPLNKEDWESKAFPVLDPVKSELFPHVVVEHFYDDYPKVPFPREVLRRAYGRTLPPNSRPFLRDQVRLRFDRIEINPPGFGVRQFFLYTEFDGAIAVWRDGTGDRDPMSAAEYIRLFGGLDIDFAKTALRNEWLFPPGGAR